jgi:hypothetical protein
LYKGLGITAPLTAELTHSRGRTVSGKANHATPDAAGLLGFGRHSRGVVAFGVPANKPSEAHERGN